MLCTGVPGTGKTTLAEAITKEHHAALLNWDWMMSAVRVFPEVWETLANDADQRRDVGYTLMSRMLEYRLRLGQSSVLDCVARPRAVRQWNELCDRYNTPFIGVECVLPDEAEHRGRIEGRDRAIPGWDELEWAFVANSRAIYEPLKEPKLTINATNLVDNNLALLRAHITETCIAFGRRPVEVGSSDRCNLWWC